MEVRTGELSPNRLSAQCNSRAARRLCGCFGDRLLLGKSRRRLSSTVENDLEVLCTDSILPHTTMRGAMQFSSLARTSARACAVRRQSPFTLLAAAKRMAGPSVPLSQVRRYAAAGTKLVKATAEMYPEIKRDERFGTLTDADVAHFRSVLSSENGVLFDGEGEDLAAYNVDTMRKYRGQSRLVLKPRSTEEVSAVMKYCGERNLAVVPQGGNTSLVGGSVPVFDEVVLCLSNMNKVRSFDDISGVLVADAGCILEATDNYLAERGYIFPLDLGAKGSCHIGGNVATNAGGLRLLRYGSLHGTVLGLEVVMADGTVVNGLGKLRKDNTGYDVKQLFIGSEGTLGIITAISILCPRRSQAVNVAFFALQSYEHVQQAFVRARTELSEILSAFEFMDRESLDQVQRFAEGRTRPLDDADSPHPFYVLVETSGSSPAHDEEKLQNYLEGLLEDGVIEDGVVAQDESQIKNLWNWREGIPESLSKSGGVYKYDVSIPLAELYKMVEDTRELLSSHGIAVGTEDSNVVNVVGYGHLGDGNLHLNVAVKSYDKHIEHILEPWVYEWIEKRQGSISAEHGIGFAKRRYLRYSKDPSMIHLMRQVKAVYDPNGIMNPYKYI
ncbi:uncharacterized protein V1518DRAFT_411781 [Limtongia smithiae]|uniref:uncharacterized protein n=1 Tax=Limtongia smithiae TaxID=1125753 RepID=UPI0034CF4369